MGFNRVLAITLAIACFFAAFTAAPTTPTASTPGDPLASTDSIWARSSRRIELVSLQGPISGDAANLAGASRVSAKLRALAKNDQVKGVLLNINSPGGTVGASQELYRAVEAVRAEKPVIAAVGDLAASGGYYAASAADEIIANPGSLVGSIGVIIQGINAEGLFEKIGVSQETIKTGPFKDLLSPSRPLSEAERTLLQELVDDAYDQFIEDVAKGRQHLSPYVTETLSEEGIAQREGMTDASVRRLADGRIMTGRQGLEVGLVDELGGYEEALTRLREWIGDDDVPISSEFPDLNEFWNLFRSQSFSLSNLGSSMSSLGDRLLHSLLLSPSEAPSAFASASASASTTPSPPAIADTEARLLWQAPSVSIAAHL